MRVPDVARILFPVEVTLEPPTFTMSAEDTDIVEGMSGRLTVSASRPVSMDTEVMIVRDGTSSAGDDDYELDPMTVTIEAREMSGHTLVEAVEDGTAEDGEVLTLFAVVDGVQMPDVSVSFRLWDAAVPALPFVAPLFAGGVPGYRRIPAPRAAAARRLTGRPTPGSGQDVARRSAAAERLWSSPAVLDWRHATAFPPTCDPHGVRGRPRQADGPFRRHRAVAAAGGPETAGRAAARATSRLRVRPAR